MSDIPTGDQFRPQLPALEIPKIENLSRSRLKSMAAAGKDVLDCLRVLETVDLNIVGEVLRGHGTFYEHEHYPPEDVFDRHSQSQYYYHAHRDASGENGHFHTFLRAPGMPAGTKPVAYSGVEPWPTGPEALSHIIAISMDTYGRPIGLFAVNRWVTAEAWYAGEDVVRMLDRFVIDHAYPSWPVNRWISAMMRLFRPQIDALIRHRDAVVRAWAITYPGIDVLEDRNLELTGHIAIQIDQQIDAIRAALAH